MPRSLLPAMLLLIGVIMHAAEIPLPDLRTAWDWNDAAASEKRFTELVERAHAAGERVYEAKALCQRARAQGLQRRFDDADKTLDDVVAMGDRGAEVTVSVALERGRVLNDRGDKAAAVEQFRQAWDTGVAAKLEDLALDAAHMLGIASPSDDALRWNEKAVVLAEASADRRVRAWLGPLYNNQGWALHDRGDFTAALVWFEKALAYYSAASARDETLVARWTVARCLRSLGRVDEALAKQRELAEEYTKIGQTDPYVFEEIGECLYALGKTDEARPHFAKAYEALSQDEHLKANEPKRLERMKTLGSGNP
jgi:tetratricopeptide (TPR) repeat protein